MMNYPALFPLLLLFASATARADSLLNFVAPLPPSVIQLDEPKANEVVVIINHNAVLGNHAGVFTGARLSDPAGSYRNARSGKDWAGPSLPDYVDYQLVDGPRIKVYRFVLSAEDFSEAETRMPASDVAMPLFCGAAVNNVIAGIGPFRSVETVYWESPAAVAEKLDAILAANPEIGFCQMPDGSKCVR